MSALGLIKAVKASGVPRDELYIWYVFSVFLDIFVYVHSADTM